MRSLAELPPLAIDPGRPWALLADLHANVEALEAVLGGLAAASVDQAVVLGDLVGYGASPAEVVDAVRRQGWPAVRGNHEELVLGTDVPGLVKDRALAAAEWTRERLDAEALAYLGSLPTASRIGPGVIAVHGSLVDPRHCHAYIYDLSLDLNIRRLAELRPLDGTLVVHGHTHWPRLYEVTPAAEGPWEWKEHPLVPGEEIPLGDAFYFVNPGSVGYPRDGDPRSSFMVWDPGRRVLRYERLAYDVEAAARRLEEAAIHDELAPRLRAAR